MSFTSIVHRGLLTVPTGVTAIALALPLLLMPSTAWAGVKVTTTVPDLAALVREIGGQHAEVSSLSLPTQDPHWVDARPNLALQINRADLLVAVGAELEVGWLPVLQTSARNPKVQRGSRGFLECSEAVELLDKPKGPIDRSMGDIHSSGSPHYLVDPRAAKICARAIAERLAEIDSDHGDAYRQNYAAFAERLDERRKSWEKRMAPFRGTAIVAYHKSWSYLSNWLDLRMVEHLEPKPGISPSPSHVVRVIRVARSEKVRLLIQESYFPTKTGELVASKIGARVLALPAGTDVRGGQTYIEHMEDIVSQLERALRGEA